MSEPKKPDDARKRMYEEKKRLKQTMGRIKHKIAVISGKGGVGKSTVTANLGLALAWHGYEVGILDADLHGPCIPKLLGMRGYGLQWGPPGAFPAVGALRMKVVSMDFLLTDEAPLIWRGPLKMKAIEQFLSDIVWGSLDFLLVDLPPGTGDEALSVMQLIPEMNGVIIVTIPSEVSQIVVKKAVTFARQMKVPIIGVVENMSGFVCPKCGEETDIFKAGGGRKIAEDMTTPFLGSIPLDPRVCEDSDKGTPFIVAHAETPAAKAFMEMVKQVEAFLKLVKPQVEGAPSKGVAGKGE
ncbi:MAG: Mrp/NBP35 family ATP-binding protein [Aigarchaeota archaeon]|nr:Mrp/NBP35 family ATP-binding protein [Aigarchaeota archaeon]